MKTNTNYTLRLPSELRGKLEKLANNENRTLSNLIIKLLKEGVEN